MELCIKSGGITHFRKTLKAAWSCNEFRAGILTRLNCWRKPFHQIFSLPYNLPTFTIRSILIVFFYWIFAVNFFSLCQGSIFISASNTNTRQDNILRKRSSRTGNPGASRQTFKFEIDMLFCWKNVKNIFGIDSLHIVNRAGCKHFSRTIRFEEHDKGWCSSLCSQPDRLKNGCLSSNLILKEYKIKTLKEMVKVVVVSETVY